MAAGRCGVSVWVGMWWLCVCVGGGLSDWGSVALNLRVEEFREGEREISRAERLVGLVDEGAEEHERVGAALRRRVEQRLERRVA